MRHMKVSTYMIRRFILTQDFNAADTTSKEKSFFPSPIVTPHPCISLQVESQNLEVSKKALVIILVSTVRDEVYDIPLRI